MSRQGLLPLCLFVVSALIGCKEGDLSTSARLQAQVVAGEVQQHARRVAAAMTEDAPDACAMLPWRARVERPSFTLEGSLRVWLTDSAEVPDSTTPTALDHRFRLQKTPNGDLEAFEENTTPRRYAPGTLTRSRSLQNIAGRGWYISEDGAPAIEAFGGGFEARAQQMLRETAEGYEHLLSLVKTLDSGRETLTYTPNGALRCAPWLRARRAWLDALAPSLEIIAFEAIVTRDETGAPIERTIQAAWRVKGATPSTLHVAFNDRARLHDDDALSVPIDALRARRDRGYARDRRLLRDALIRRTFPALLKPR